MRIQSRKSPAPASTVGFSLVEALMTVALIGILTGVAITYVSNASRDASRMVAKQQAAEMQNAVSSWASSNAMMRDSTTGQLKSIESTRAAYNAASTTSARFNLIKSFLDDTIADHFLSNTASTDKLQSEALINSKQYLKLEDWAAGAGYPKVSLMNE